MTFPVGREIYAGIFNRGLPTLDSPVVDADTDTLTRPVEQEDDGCLDGIRLGPFDGCNDGSVLGRAVG